MGKKFKHLPLVVKQAQTKVHAMSAATLQVQLCEYRFLGGAHSGWKSQTLDVSGKWERGKMINNIYIYLYTYNYIYNYIYTLIYI
jgi:hypothetical protein